jgi:hypothetical protein
VACIVGSGFDTNAGMQVNRASGKLTNARKQKKPDAFIATLKVEQQAAKDKRAVCAAHAVDQLLQEAHDNPEGLLHAILQDVRLQQRHVEELSAKYRKVVPYSHAEALYVTMHTAWRALQKYLNAAERQRKKCTMHRQEEDEDLTAAEERSGDALEAGLVEGAGDIWR